MPNRYDPYGEIEAEDNYNDNLSDLASEFGTGGTNKYKFSCNDKMCGAEDCETCHPGCSEETEK
jgi:hypothetical protein